MTTVTPINGPVASTGTATLVPRAENVRGYLWALTVTALGLGVLFWGTVDGLATWLELWNTPPGLERIVVELLCGAMATVAGFGLLVRAQGPDEDPLGRFAGDGPPE